MKRLIILVSTLSALLISGSVFAGKMDVPRIEKIWQDKVITLPDQSVPDIEYYFNVISTAFSNDVLQMAYNVYHEIEVTGDPTGYVIMDKRNGYMRAGVSGEQEGNLQMCYWKVPDGRRIVGVILSENVNVIKMFYEHRIEEQILKPLPALAASIPDATRYYIELPQKGKDITVYVRGEEYQKVGHLEWDGFGGFDQLDLVMDRCYYNERFGFTIRYPFNFTGQGEPENGDGQLFISDSGLARFYAYGGYNSTLMFNQTLREHFEEKCEGFREAGYIIDDTLISEDEFYIIGHKDDSYIYKKAIIVDDIQLNVVITFDSVIADDFLMMAHQIAATLIKR